jgi:hypothetical protein
MGYVQLDRPDGAALSFAHCSCKGCGENLARGENQITGIFEQIYLGAQRAESAT